MSDILMHNAISKGTRDMRVELLGEPVDISGILSNPLCYSLWSAVIPKIPTPVGQICVYDSGTYFRAGGTCTWTVPTGVTKARFELWGAGAGSQAGNCCGHGPTGNSGSYASVCMTVTPGEAYVLCAGAANSTLSYCCQSCDISGCQSFVTGAGLTNFCANGGCASLLYTMTQLGNAYATAQGKYAGQGYGGSQSGITIAGTGFSATCHPSSQPTGVLRRDFLAETSFFGTAANATVYGLKSQNSALQMNASAYGCECTYSLPLPNGTMSPIVCDGFTSGTCCGSRGVQACSGYGLIPGHGGYYSHIMGGNTAGYGDWGRTGMVKVSWA